MPDYYAEAMARKALVREARAAAWATCPWREFASDRKCCDYCGARLPKYRRNWCDDDCAQSYAYNHDWKLAKLVVWTRESRACCHCGIFVLSWSDHWHPDYPVRPINTGIRELDFQRHNNYSQVQVKAFYDSHKGELGEVDHIVECNGNYNNGCHNHTSNLRLLCRACHRSRAQWDHENVPMELVIPGHDAAIWARNAA